MQLIAEYDLHGNREHLTSSDLRRILDLIDGYMSIPYQIKEIWRDDVNDKNGRIDIEVEYIDNKKHLIRQKLLILNDELIDGKTFHKRI